MLTREQAYNKLEADGYHVDRNFQPNHGGIFCLGWKQRKVPVRSVMSDGSVIDTYYLGETREMSIRYDPGEKFPAVDG